MENTKSFAESGQISKLLRNNMSERDREGEKNR